MTKNSHNFLSLSDPVENIPLIGPRNKTLLNRLGIETVHDLLYHLPLRHEDTREILDISTFTTKGEGTIKVQVSQIQNVRARRMTLTKAVVTDGDRTLNVVWFNQPFLTNNIKPDTELLLSGKIDGKLPLQLKSPQYELLKGARETTHLGRISPIYNITKGLSVKWLRSRLKHVIENLDSLIHESHKQSFLKKYQLLNITEALKKIHFPEDPKDVAPAIRRLAFDELLEIQKIMIEKRDERVRSLTCQIRPLDMAKIENLFDFDLTTSQTQSIQEIFGDFEKNYPSNRLLAGDVGSGKTAVAIAASLAASTSGKKVLYMAPTNLLANQHFETFKKYLDRKATVSLITGRQNKSDREGVYAADIIIGTQALLFADIEKLIDIGLIIIDEQHRFGTLQRETLSKSLKTKEKPHILTLTATPIPRTLTLSYFGDIEVSYLDEVPTGRLPIKTHLVSEKKREDSYKWVEKQIKDHNAQVFIVTPLIDESEKVAAKSAEQEYKILSEKVFPNLRVSLLHGKTKEKDKNKILQDFSDRKTDILVATPVIEVGIDIPGATIIVIENAERFGLAQLHQIRGRVGRNDKQSHCLIFYEELSEVSQKRLATFAKETSGLKLAETDLILRGPGEVYGTRQSGLPNLHVASLTDIELVKQTREAALDLYS